MDETHAKCMQLDCNLFKEQDTVRLVPDVSYNPQLAIILDWDDTVMPTSWLEKQHVLESPIRLRAEQSRLLKMLAARVGGLIELARRLGDVFIFTNAAVGWVEVSCDQFLSSISPLVRQVPIFAKPLSASVLSWKIETFRRELTVTRKYTDIISIGDGPIERQAILRLQSEKFLVKSVKLQETPSIQHLVSQHEYLLQRLYDVVHCSVSLDLRLTLSSIPNSSGLELVYPRGLVDVSSLISCSFSHITRFPMMFQEVSNTQIHSVVGQSQGSGHTADHYVKKVYYKPAANRRSLSSTAREGFAGYSTSSGPRTAVQTSVKIFSLK